MSTKHRGTPWQPADIEQFTIAYNKGATNKELADACNGTFQEVKHYVGKQVETGVLQRRSKLVPISEVAPDEDVLNARIMHRLRAATAAVDLTDLANEFDVSPRRIETVIADLANHGRLVTVENGHARIAPPESGRRSSRHAEYLDDTRKFRFAIASDAHLCSKYARLDHLNTFFDICQEEGVKLVFDAGNQIDGEARFNKADLLVHGMGAQINFWAENWPKREGIETQFICGDDHEGWYLQRESIDIGWHMQQVAKEKYGRTDLKYLGYMEHDVSFVTPEGGETIVRVQHPGGGSAYALSYTPQKIVESLSGGDKPNILILGHYHKSGYFFPRNVHAVLAGCFMDQSPFMRKKRLAAHVGGWIIEVTQAPDGSVLRFNSTFIPFYGDNKDEKWSYKFD